MIRLLIPLLLVGGFAMGWLLPPHRPSSKANSLDQAPSREERLRITRKGQLLTSMLDDDDLAAHRRKNATSLSSMLAGVRGAYDINESDAARIVDMDPASALDTLLADPAASSDVCKKIAAEWSRRNPEQAIRFLKNKPSYRADDCLYEVLFAAYPTVPEQVGEVIRAKSRRWQARHLEDMFSKTSRVRAEGAPPEEPSDDPFADDGYWRTARFGEDLLDYLADDALREEARRVWSKESEEPAAKTPPSDPPTEIDVAKFDRDAWFAVDPLREMMKDNREKALAEIAERGNFEARATAMWLLVGEFPMDSKSWPEGLARVESWIEQLDVIPQYPPNHFERGPFLRGEVAAAWIDRQPLALQRAWGPTFTETWAQSEPREAVEWARTLPEAAARDEAIQSGMIVWAHEQPLAASAYVEALPPGDVRESAISNTAAAWSCIDRSGAAAWLATLPHSPGKARALKRVK